MEKLSLKFNDKHRPNLEPSIENLTFTVQLGKKLASLERQELQKLHLADLVRLSEFGDGYVKIDGVDIK